MEIEGPEITSNADLAAWLAKVASGEWTWARIATLEAALAEARAQEREQCAQIGYRVCAETRHVTLGDKVAATIRSQKDKT